jgi:hypothetical protein
MKETGRMQADRTVLPVIVLLGSCPGQGSSGGDGREVSADRAREASVGAVDANLQIRYTTGIRAIFTEQHGLGIREKGPSGSLGRIFAIAEDAAGSMWFGTRDNGAWRFDGESFDRIS